MSSLGGPSHSSSARARVVAEWRSLSSPAIWLPKCDVSPPRPFISVLVLSVASHLAAHVCLSSSHSYDLGVRAAPTPAHPWISLPCHYSVVPPAMQLHVRLSRTRLKAGLVQPQTLLGRVAPSMASTHWKMMWVSQRLELSFLFEVRFRDKLYLKVFWL